MFARVVLMNLKPHCQEEFSQILHTEVTPLFESHSDFAGFIVVIHANGTEALTLSIWDGEEGAKQGSVPAFQRLAALSRVLRGSPAVRVHPLPTSTLQSVMKLLSQGQLIQEDRMRVYKLSEPSFRILSRRVNIGPEEPPFHRS